MKIHQYSKNPSAIVIIREQSLQPTNCYKPLLPTVARCPACTCQVRSEYFIMCPIRQSRPPSQSDTLVLLLKLPAQRKEKYPVCTYQVSFGILYLALQSGNLGRHLNMEYTGSSSLKLPAQDKEFSHKTRFLDEDKY